MLYNIIIFLNIHIQFEHKKCVIVEAEEGGFLSLSNYDQLSILHEKEAEIQTSSLVSPKSKKRQAEKNFIILLNAPISHDPICSSKQEGIANLCMQHVMT